MAQNDMYVVMYKILAYLYDCMKRGVEPDRAKFSNDALGIPQEYWMDVMEELAEHGYVKGISVLRYIGGRGIEIERPRVTMEGVAFAQENTMMERARKFLQDAKAAIPFV